jgi:hypothetical protein
MLNKVPSVQVCDARMLNRYSNAGYVKYLL